MFLQKLTLINFKNYEEAELVFAPGVNCFAGNNGAGKTNLLDAIHYLCLCKSFFNPIDSQQIRHDQPFFVIQGVFDREGKKEQVYCGVKRHQKKQFKRNGKEYSRLADHIGLFPLVMISPYDVNLVTEGSEERRKFIDSIISQVDNAYLEELIIYNKVLINRNALLKQFYDTNTTDEDMIGIYNDQLTKSGKKIFGKRKQFIETFIPVFEKHYREISGDAEQVNLAYESQLLEDEPGALLERSLQRDIVLQRTTTGVHKDDIIFSIQGYPLKKYGSQGQQKSYLIALKLAQYTFLHEQKGYKPLLLLDDIFDKLDEHRTATLLKMVSKGNFGQIFITETSRSRLENIFRNLGVPAQIFEVSEGKITDHAGIK